MAVPNIPFYLSQANQEFLGTPTGNASVTMNTAGVAVPGNVSQLAGLSAMPPSTSQITLGREQNVIGYDPGGLYNTNTPMLGSALDGFKYGNGVWVTALAQDLTNLMPELKVSLSNGFNGTVLIEDVEGLWACTIEFTGGWTATATLPVAASWTGMAGTTRAINITITGTADNDATVHTLTCGASGNDVGFISGTMGNFTPPFQTAYELLTGLTTNSSDGTSTVRWDPYLYGACTFIDMESGVPIKFVCDADAVRTVGAVMPWSNGSVRTINILYNPG